MWVDDTVVMLQRDPDYPLQGTLVDQRAYFEGVMKVALAVKKMQYATTGKPQTLLFITPERAKAMAGVPWVQATEAQKRECLRWATEIRPKDKLHYMGTTIWVRGRNMAPEGLIEVRGQTRAELAKVRAALDTTVLIVQAKVPIKFYSKASA